MRIRKHFRFYEGEGTGSNTPPGGQAPQGSQPPTGAGGQPTGQESGGGKSASDYEKMISDLRAENAKHRTENNELKAFKDKAEAEKLSESEKLQKAAKDAADRATHLESALKETRTQAAVERAARKLNIVDEEAAYALLDKSKIEFDGDTPKNIEALLTDLVKTKTYLVGQAGGNGGGSSSSATNPPRGNAGGSLSIEAIKQMTPQQIAALPKAEFDKVMAAVSGR